VNRGQVTFIVGGNGSGKSTLGKLITSHYLPSGGAVFLDGRELDRGSINSFRDQVAAIWTDYYLFDRLLGEARAADASVIEKYLERLQLAQKVNLMAGRFSTLALSDGQRKRLALLVSFLENKPLHVFDEWAADQDPEFKAVFYREILPYLKAQDKAVVVITHDDRYFDVADRILTLENGQLVPATVRVAAGAMF
jgi:putative ATP-binding cassette transporter